ncbi:MAG: hypothetical protein ACC707_04580 [Thiohalomonadales bacterium]
MTLVHKFSRFGLMLLILSVVACSNDDNSSTPAAKQALVTQENARTFTIGSMQARQQGQAQDSINSLLGGLFTGGGASNSQAISLAADFGTNALTGALDKISCGGDYVFSDNTSQPNSFDFNIQFSDFCIDDGGTQTTLNGGMGISGNMAADMTISFNNLSISGAGMNETLNCSLTIKNGTIQSDTCGMLNTGSGTSTTPASSKLSVTGDDTTGYIIEGTLYDGNGEYVSVSTPTATRLFFDTAICPAYEPSAGLVEIKGSNETRATANFSDNDNDCTTFRLCIYTGAQDTGTCTTEVF